MKITQLPAEHAARLVPLLKELHQLHVEHQPERHPANPNEADLQAWLESWLAEDTVHALVAESPTGALLGYTIYEVQARPKLPVTLGGTRVMLHHIAVAGAMRRMGIAKALVTAVKHAAAASGATTLVTTYAPFNTASARLMQAMGLTPSLIQAELQL